MLIVYHVINVQNLMMDHFHPMTLIGKHFVGIVTIHNEQNQQRLIIQNQKISMSGYIEDYFNKKFLLV